MKSARVSHMKVVFEGEEDKIIISGDQFKKRASNALFLSGHCIEKNPIALRARILKLFIMGKKLNSLCQGITLKRGHQIR